MKEKEKAIQLVDKMYGETPIMLNHVLIEYAQNTAKKCALLCVDEIMNQFIEIHNNFKGANLIKGDVEDSANYIYWEQVKKEIELL